MMTLDRIADKLFFNFCMNVETDEGLKTYYENGLDTIHRILDEQGKLLLNNKPNNRTKLWHSEKKHNRTRDIY